MMKIDVSVGELVDKLSILSIKLKKIRSSEKLKNIRREYDLLKSSMEETEITVESDEFKELVKVNSTLWDIEDRIRLKEAKKEFDSDFIELARSIYKNNDYRARMKKIINYKYDSELTEEKEYADY
jgi:hypothetical protein